MIELKKLYKFMSKFYLSYKFNNETISFLQAKDILNNSIKAFIHSLKSMRMYVYASKGIIFREKSRVTLEDIFIPYPKKSEVIVETIKMKYWHRNCSIK